MKSTVSMILAAVGIGALILFGTRFVNPVPNEEGNVLHVYNWGEYIDPDLLAKFEEETGIRVIYETFDSNEAMKVKVNQGGTNYDVVFPSEYMVEKMVVEDLLMPLDHEQIPNMKNIGDNFLDQPFDPGNTYSLPYFWGTVGVLYHPETTEGLDFSDWDTLWDDRLENDILMVDGAREVMGVGLNSMGHSLNETNEEVLQEAEEKLEALGPNVRGIVGDEIAAMMEVNEAKAAVVWSGMAQDIMWENEALDFTVPEGGSNLWFDTMVIPRTAQNVEGAHQFMNFLLDPENGAQNTEWVGYATPNEAAYQLLDKEIRQDERFYPDQEQQEELEVYRNLGPEMISLYNELFLRFKMALE
ncbi:PotD/PotF family extracellular solute-binding protein [Salinicoccus hispanicus]|uniref:Extracellular solute-binding protein n=1 Tax=Salinicoccus hispanicus TaxID=157225 RepID=A0A6N8TVM7_9STAP|nr:spermidine/putrescine ABC transporter substrate-binding protein [Salinicoccus hispanicus]MXQ49750.1 extracellular solute-binding protein [Salinicoccus hispanicus]